MFYRRFPLRLGAIVLVAILLRAAVMLRGPGPFDDPDNYLPLARSLAEGGGFCLRWPSHRLSAAALSADARPADPDAGHARLLGSRAAAHLPGCRHGIADSDRGQRFRLVGAASADRWLLGCMRSRLDFPGPLGHDRNTDCLSGCGDIGRTHLPRRLGKKSWAACHLGWRCFAGRAYLPVPSL